MDREKGDFEEFLSKAGRKIDALFADFKESEIAGKLAVKERLEELKRDKERLAEEMKRFSDNNKDTIDNLRNSMEESIEDIKQKFKRRPRT